MSSACLVARVSLSEGKLENNIIYDASEVAQPLMGFWMVLIALAIAAIAVLIIFFPRIARQGDQTIVRLVAVLVALAAVSTLSFSAFRWFRSLSSVSHHQGNMTVIQGCVINFNRTVNQNEHNLADTYFAIGSTPFHFNSSPWFPGFHNEEDVIKPGDGLRIFRRDGTIVKILRAPEACHSST